MPASKILGPDGRPIVKTELSREVASVSVSGIRRRYTDSAAKGLTPDRLAHILRAAADDDAHAYLTLAEEMEERSAQYAAVISTRRRAVLGLPRIVEAASDDPKDIEYRDAVETHLVRQPAFGRLCAALLDAIGKGYSAVEVRVDTSKMPWAPRDIDRVTRAYSWRDPRYFVYDRVTGRELRMLDEADTYNGVALLPWRFVVHEPSLKMGLPIRGGVARLVAVSYMLGSFTLENWLMFSEIFGMPLRLGRYPDRFANSDNPADKKSIELLQSAVADLAANAAGILPESMDIEFVAASSGAGSADLFERLAERLDKMISKAVLGRSDAADSTAGKLGSEKYALEVRRDILESDAEELSNTLNEQLVQPFIAMNWGPQEAYPRIKLQVPDQEDLAGLADMLAKLVPLGLEVEQSVIRDKWGLPDPDPKGKLLGAPSPPAGPALNRAINRQGGGHRDEIDVLRDEALEEWEPLLAPSIDPVRELADKATTFDEFMSGLRGILNDMEADQLVESLAKAALKAHGAGDAGAA